MSQVKLVIKRDKKAQPFSIDKVKSAIGRVFKNCNETISKEKVDELISGITFTDGMRTEEIQRAVEDQLMKYHYYNEARFFIIYRHIHYYDKYLGNKVKFMREYLGAENAATGSVFDPNANVTETNLTTLTGELFKGDIIKLNRYRMYGKISQMYGKELADWYIYQLEHHFLYRHDESSLFPYCASISLYPYLLHGLGQLGGLSTPPKNLDSFCGSFPNLVFAVAAQFAGAISTSEFIPYFDYFARKDLGNDYTQHLDDFILLGPKIRQLLNSSHIWFRNINELKNHVFATDYENELKKEIIEDSTRPYNDEEIKQVIKDTKAGVPISVKLGDGTRTIGAYLVQKFQQIVYTLNQPKQLWVA